MNATATRHALAKAWAEAEASGASLQSQIDQYVRASREIIPDVMAAYDRMVERITLGEAGSASPRVGEYLPDALLPDQNGHLISISKLYAAGPLVISFNRGHWCPYCRLELRALKAAAPSIARASGGLISIVPETAEFSSRMIAMSDLSFVVLSDIDLDYALELGLSVWIGDEMKALYAGRGVDLARYQVNGGWMLPIPATFVIARGGMIVCRSVDPEFRHRMEVETILAALKDAEQS